MPESNSSAQEVAVNTSHLTANTAQLVLQVSHDVAKADSLDEQLHIIMEAVTKATNQNVVHSFSMIQPQMSSIPVLP